MTLPGVEVLTDDVRPPRGPRLTLSTVYICGVADAGSAVGSGDDQPVEIRSLRDLVAEFGDRDSDNAPVYDWVDAYFREGGSRAYVVPVGTFPDSTDIADALELFSRDLGPGSVVLPGITDEDSQIAAIAHAVSHNRLARLEALDTGDVSDLVDQADALRDSAEGADGAAVADLIAPTLNIPGLAADSGGRTVSATALRCAAEAVNDQQGISPNQAAAGRWAVADYASTPTRTWGDSDLETLNDAGVNVTRVVDGLLRVYGMRTLADPDTAPVALSIGSARLRMGIEEISRANAEQFAFAEIDQGGVELGHLEGLIRGGISRYAASLFALDVNAELIADPDHQGQYLVEVVVEFQAAPGAERVRVVVTRQLTEV